MTAQGSEGETGILRCSGQQLRVLRMSRGLTRTELGVKLSYGEDMVASVELRRHIPKPEFIERADAALEAGGLPGGWRLALHGRRSSLGSPCRRAAS